jgi:DNA-binding NtrC family response regulator
MLAMTEPNATNVDLQTRVTDGSFREDLFYRLNVVELRLPPLRERVEGLPDLVRSILVRIARKRGSAPCHVTAAALQ